MDWSSPLYPEETRVVFVERPFRCLILLCIIVVSIPVALIIYKLLFGWERQLTHSHIHQKLSFFSWNRKNLYGLHFDERSFGDGGGRLIIYFSKRKDFSLSFFLTWNQDLQKDNCIWLEILNCLINTYYVLCKIITCVLTTHKLTVIRLGIFVFQNK